MDARTSGCYLTPDQGFLSDLLEGLKSNEERYGYPSCPCRMAASDFELDKDIICPCWYRDPDVEEFGACYCALYVSRDVYEGRRKLSPIPERRPLERQIRAYSLIEPKERMTSEKVSVESQLPTRKLLYCRQCGYTVFREEPPYICPICKAKREMFSVINIQLNVESMKYNFG